MEDKKVSQQINDIVGDNVRKLAVLFPTAVKDGEVDFDALREELGQFKEVSAEKYELTWAGKKQAKKLAQEDIVGRTLKYCPEESSNPDETENLYIEGDNLEVLKLLRQNYYGAIKLIYIDPPYNTGNDFVYNDSFAMTKEESDIEEGNIDEFGERYTINKSSSNRYHAKWMSMIYPRLKVAKDLLADDGVIFISIDDHECANLKSLCDEIFGEINFVADVIWQHSVQSNGYGGKFVNQFNHTLVYAKSEMFSLGYLERTDKDNALYRNPDNDPKGPWRSGYCVNGLYRPNLKYEIHTPSGNVIQPPDKGWRWSKETLMEKMKANEIIFNENETGIIHKLYLSDLEGKVPENIWVGGVAGTTRQATAELKELFNGYAPFDTPKPVELIKRIISLSTNDDDIIMDFFSGASTTAHAVMELNSSTGGKRKFIMVQLPEKCELKSDAQKREYKTICDVGRERIRRAGKKIIDEEGKNIDVGFKAFKTGNTNIKWSSLLKEGQLNLAQIESTPDLMDFMPDSKDEDIVYELILRQRDVPLSERLERLTDIGERTYLYADSYLVCLECKITEEMVDKLAGLDPVPVKFIFRDSAFGDDIALKDESFRRLKAVIDKNAGSAKVSYTVEFI